MSEPVKMPTRAAEVGRRVKEARLKTGMKARQFAAYTGIDRSTLSRIERGQLPQLATLEWIAQAAGVSLQHLLEGPKPAMLVQPTEWSKLPPTVPSALFTWLHHVALERPELLPITPEETRRLIWRYERGSLAGQSAAHLDAELTGMRLAHDASPKAREAFFTSIDRLAAEAHADS